MGGTAKCLAGGAMVKRIAPIVAVIAVLILLKVLLGGRSSD